MAINKKKIESIETRSVYFQEILQRVPSKIIRWGNAFFAVVFVLFLLGMKFIEYPEVIESEIKVSPENPASLVRALNSGKVSHQLADDDNPVQTGDWIFVLENNADLDEMRHLQSLLNQLETGQFWLLVDSLELRSYQKLGDVSSTYYRFKRSVEEYELVRQTNLEFAKLALNSNRQAGLSSVSSSFDEQLRLTKKELDLLEQNLNRYQELYKKGVVSKLQVEQVEMQYLATEEEYERIKSQKINSNLNRYSVQQENLDLQANRTKNFFDIRNDILTQFGQLLFEFNRWKLRYVLYAPHSGVLNLFDIRHVNQFVTNEQEVFSITPDEKGDFFGYIKIPVANSGKIAVGQKVMIKLNDYPHTEYGIIEGQVSNLSRIPLQGYYHSKVKLVSGLTTSRGESLNDRHELYGMAEVVTEPKSLLDRLFNLVSSIRNK